MNTAHRECCSGCFPRRLLRQFQPLPAQVGQAFHSEPQTQRPASLPCGPPLGSLGTTMCFQGSPWVPLHLSQAGLHLSQRYQRAFLPSIWIIPPNTSAKRRGHHCYNLQTASPPGEVKGPVFYLRSCSQEDGWAPPLKVLEPPLWLKPGWVKGVISRKGQQGCSWPLSRDRKSPEGPNTDDTGSSKGKKAEKEAGKFRPKHPHFTRTRFCYIQPQHLLHLTLGFIFNRCHCTFLSSVVMERWASTGTSWGKSTWCLLPSRLPTLSHQGQTLCETPQNGDPNTNSHHCAQPKPLRSSRNSFLTRARNLWAQVLGILPTRTRPKK